MEAPILTKHDNEAGGGGDGFTTANATSPLDVDASVAAAAPLMATATSSRAPDGQSTTGGGGYTWNDTHFNQTEGIIAVFDFDYNKVSKRARADAAPRLPPPAVENWCDPPAHTSSHLPTQIIDFDWDRTKCCYAMCPVVPLVSAPCCAPCFAKSNIMWTTRAMHVAVHQDGIKFVNDHHKTWCGLTCTDKGKNSKTVPFDKLTDCDVQEPAGAAVCCFVPNVLSTVIVDTASSGGADPNSGIVRHELNLRGLVDPHGFKKCVWDCKRSAVNLRGGSEGIPIPMAGAGGMEMDRGVTEHTALLSEIRDELKVQTKLLQEAASAGSAP